jgi:diacylglycerol kinase
MKNQRLTDSFRTAAKGFYQAFRREYHIKVAFLLTFIAVGYSCVLGLTLAEWTAVVMLSAMVVSLEMMNTALEKLADAVHPEWSEEVGLSKDLAAGAVLVSVGAAAAVGFPMFVSAFCRRFAVSLTYGVLVNLTLFIIGIGLLLIWDMFRR